MWNERKKEGKKEKRRKILLRSIEKEKKRAACHSVDENSKFHVTLITLIYAGTFANSSREKKKKLKKSRLSREQFFFFFFSCSCFLCFCSVIPWSISRRRDSRATLYTLLGIKRSSRGLKDCVLIPLLPKFFLLRLSFFHVYVYYTTIICLLLRVWTFWAWHLQRVIPCRTINYQCWLRRDLNFMFQSQCAIHWTILLKYQEMKEDSRCLRRSLLKIFIFMFIITTWEIRNTLSDTQQWTC